MIEWMCVFVSVRMCVCCMHAGVVLSWGLYGLFSTTFVMLLTCVFVVGNERGEGTTLSLFLAHYIIIIINIIAVWLLALQPVSF